MAISFIGIGAVGRATGSITPTPPTYSSGNTLLYFTGEYFGTDNIATPSGWTLLSRDSGAQQIKCFGFDAVGGDTIPAVNWGAVNAGWAQIMVLAGCASVASILDGVGGDRASNNTANVIGPAGIITPSAGNECVIFFGARTKTATSNGTVLTAPAGFTIASQSFPNGTQICPVIGYWLQSTATAIPANSVYTGSIADSTVQTNEGSILILKPSAVAPSSRSAWGLMGVGS